MKTIEISKLKLAELIIENSDLRGDNNWGIYINAAGDMDVRHSTHENESWVEIYNFYNGYETEVTDDPENFSQLFDNGWLAAVEENINYDYETQAYELGWVE
jgi:hypothetical protein